MVTTDKPTVLILATLLESYGVRDIVVSSGTRCAPLTVALARSDCFRLHPVIDERSAAFVGLGMSLATGRPVALVCTSGSAPLNYAPALAEAYYRRVPLIAISADRPAWWIGQREGQTIRQAGCLSSVCRCSVDLSPDNGSAQQQHEAVRLINKALDAATGIIKGPVHINVQIDAPMNRMEEEKPYPAPMICRQSVLCHDSLSKLDIPENTSVMLVVGGVRLDEHEREAISQLTSLPGIAVVAEAQSNIRGAFRPALFDRHLADAPVPEFLAIVGGDFVSGRFKQWLRSVSGKIRYIVSFTPEDEPVVTFGRLDANLPCSIAELAAYLRHFGGESDFNRHWRRFAGSCHTETDAPVIDMLRRLAEGFCNGDIHVSNGSAIRYVQLLTFADGVQVECNRGVSGIDGCTSTAIGSAIASGRPTLLISGDMSAAYDVGALAIRDIPPTFKMAVLDNNGGDIFRNIPTTDRLPELERYFAMPPDFPVAKLAEAYGFAYLEASEASCKDITSFLRHNGKAILRLIINPTKNKNLI